MPLNVILCKSCKAQIVWLKTRNGKSIPVDYKPEGDPYMEIFDPATMTTHFSTCPQAGQWRLKKKKIFAALLVFLLITTNVWAANVPENLRNGLIAEDASGDYQTYLVLASVVRNRLKKGMDHGLVALKRKDLDEFIDRQWWYVMQTKGINLFKVSQRAVDEVFKKHKDYANGATHYEHTGRYRIPAWARGNRMIKVKVLHRWTRGEITLWKTR